MSVVWIGSPLLILHALLYVAAYITMTLMTYL